MQHKFTAFWMRSLLSSAVVVGTLTFGSSIGLKALNPVPPAVGQTSISLDNYLMATDIKMYGASWCPFTQRQKFLLGETFGSVQYVECYPEGRKGAISQQCAGRGIQGFPTWEIDGKRYNGLMSLSELAEISGYSKTSNLNN